MMHVAIGLVFGIALAWPRVTPQVVYYTDPARGLYHANQDCPFSESPTLDSREQAGELLPCRHCLPHRSDKIADSDSQTGQQDTDDEMRPVAKH